jgi:uncharacterized membrane protein YccC
VSIIAGERSGIEAARVVAHWRDHVIAGDPGGFSARAAARALISVLASGTVLLSAGEPLSSALLGSVLALVTSIAISDARPRAQAATMALGFGAAMATICVATVVSPSVWAASLVLCAIVFAAVLARARGPRGTAVGMLAFMGYFFAVFVRARPADLPRLAPSVLVGAAAAYLARFAVVRDRPDRVRARVLRAFAARLRLLLGQIAAELLSPVADPARQRRIRRQTGRLNELALALEEAAGRSPHSPPVAAIRPWLRQLVEAEVAVDLLADATHSLGDRGASREVRRDLAAAVALVRSWIHRADPALRDEVLRRLALARSRIDAPPDAPNPSDPVRRMDACRRLDRGVRLLLAGRPWETFPDVRPAGSTVSPLSFRAGGGGTSGLHGGRPNLRLAVQATVAVALATVAGRAISPTRWYWAVIAAFTVFARAATVAETLSRAWQRVLGTAVGVGTAIVIAELLGRHAVPSVIVALVAICAAYGVFHVSYAAMILFMTIALAVLYEMMGRPVPGLMALRLGESAAGAAVGTAVAALLLPTRSGDRIRRLVADVLLQAAPVILRGTTPGVDPRGDAQLLDDIRRVDRALAEVRNALRPLWAPHVPVEVRRLTEPGRLAAAFAYTIRRFVTDIAPGAYPALLPQIGERLAANCGAVAEALAYGSAATVTPIGGLLLELGRATESHQDSYVAELCADLDTILDQLVAVTRANRGRRDSNGP